MRVLVVDRQPGISTQLCEGLEGEAVRKDGCGMQLCSGLDISIR